jgi:hypothetical protein
VAAQRHRQRQRLDRERVGDADRGESLDGCGQDPKLGEAQLYRGLARLGDLDVAVLAVVRLGVDGFAIRTFWVNLLGWDRGVQDGALLVLVSPTTGEAGRDRTGRTPA